MGVGHDWTVQISTAQSSPRLRSQQPVPVGNEPWLTEGLELDLAGAAGEAGTTPGTTRDASRTMNWSSRGISSQLSAALDMFDKHHRIQRERWDVDAQRWSDFRQIQQSQQEADKKRWEDMHGCLEKLQVRLRQLEVATDQQASKVSDGVVAIHRGVLDISDKYDRDMHGNLEKLHDHLGQVEVATHQHRTTVSADITMAHRGMEDTLQRQYRSQLIELKEELIAEIQRSCQGVQKTLKEALRLTMSHSISEPLLSLQSKIDAWVQHGRQELDDARRNVESLRLELTRVETKRKSAEQGMNFMRQESERIQKEHASLQAAQRTTALDLILEVKNIEARKNIRVNLKNGDVDLLKAMDFKPRRQSEGPIAEFVNLQAAEPVLHDVAELLRIFPVPITVEGHTNQAKGMSDEFLQELAKRRAEEVIKQLESKGVSRELMHAKALHGKTGANKACVDIKLDIFPEHD